MKILLLVPQLDKHGGVANYYNAIADSLPANASYITRGTRLGSGPLKKVYDFIMDYLKFAIAIGRYDIVVVNTSFARSGIIRDSIFCMICRIFGKPYIVFFRGWKKRFEKEVSSGFFKRLFSQTFMKAKKIIVLGNEFAVFIRQQGYKNKIVLETTIVEQKLFTGKQIEKLVSDRKATTPKLLFLSRLEKSKGILECLEVHRRLLELGYKNELLIAGSGGADNLLQDLTDASVIRLGYVSGQQKIDAYTNAHFFILPSQSEGMPNSILEAMMFGLPVLTTNVGGIKDFFTESMGISTNRPDVEAYVSYIIKVLNHEIDMHTVAVSNNKYATENFSQAVVAKRLLKEIYETYESHVKCNLIINNDRNGKQFS